MQIYKTRYIPVGDYFIPDWTLPEEPRPIGTGGRMRRDYLKKSTTRFYIPIWFCAGPSGRVWPI